MHTIRAKSSVLLILLTQTLLTIADTVVYEPCEEDLEASQVERNFAPRIQNAQPAGSLATPDTTSDPPNTIYEISDGQIQAPYYPNGVPVAGMTISMPAIQPASIAPPAQGHPPVLGPGPEVNSFLTGIAQTTPLPAISQPSVNVPPSISSPAPVSSSTVDTTPTSISTVVESTVPDTVLPSLTTSAIQTPSVPVPTNTIGSVITSLETSGAPTTLPFVTSVNTSTSSLSLVQTSTVSITPTASISITSINANDIFQPIATNAPPPQISSRADHPVPRLGIEPQQERLETNKFYANLFLGDQGSPVFTFPYSASWLKGNGQVKSWGLGISHTERSQLAHGEDEAITGAWRYYANPIGVESIILSAAQLGNGTSLTTDSLGGFSVNANLVPEGWQTPAITFPLVQGMGFITALYNSATPIISSTVGIQNLTYSGNVANSAAHKYRALLSDGTTWLLYVTSADPTYAFNSFKLLNANSAQGMSGFTGTVQVAKIPTGDISAEAVYDGTAGAYATSASIAGAVDGTTGSYSLSWTKAGDLTKSLLMFALPHHIQSFSAQTAQYVTSINLMTPTKGNGTAVAADSWTLTETDLPISMSFAPWSPGLGSVTNVSPQAQALINTAATAELAQDMKIQTDLNSMYYSGKALAKFAAVVYAAHDIALNVSLALTGLQKLEDVFETFVNNTQVYPLVYDSAWGGAVSIGTYLTGDSGLDFGNTYYNDHHFHYGYFVYAAAVIAYLDPTWLETGTNKAWVDMLVRDYANPISDDPYFPFSRCFDWYHGHSWAAGLFASADGKNQESSSEDTMASYGIKMWGRITGDIAMEARGNLMLAIQARSLADYYLYTADNTIEPAEFIPNKAAGILFENKIDHTTYFGAATEDIEGIHMIPIMPFSAFTRRAAFVAEEWNTYFLTYASQLQNSWRGILMANLAIIDPVTSFDFFANYSGNFNLGLLDGGASQTWYLSYAAALGGSPAATKREVHPSTDLDTKDGKGRVSMRFERTNENSLSRWWSHLWASKRDFA